VRVSTAVGAAVQECGAWLDANESIDQLLQRIHTLLEPVLVHEDVILAYQDVILAATDVCQC
jgi:hypothetical protein